ncbi:hypothetical protein K438DRAFT_2011897 [Mycena galopus ATCC 62051]|nr:hypothetical protein K438DRAFT_2011897 [Mycena galopus ATCC 62051]
MSFTSLALLVGLGARILLDQYTRSGEPSVQNFVVLGLWQGCGIHYVNTANKELLMPAAAVVVAKLFFDFAIGQDATRVMVTLLGIGLGFCVADLSSRWMDSSDYGRRSRKKHVHPTAEPRRRSRSIHTRRSEGDERERRPRRDTLRRAVSDITSVDTNSLLFQGRDPAMTPLDREVAALRARASLADSERRRYKEERKWAIEAGDGARAKEMSWQVKRYSALMKSFHREADDKIIEASTGVRQSTQRSERPAANPEPRTRRNDTDSRNTPEADRRRSMRVNVHAFTTTMPALPAEVAELIIDRCEHRPTLASCSLVCKAWHTRSRFRLFATPVTVSDIPAVPRVKEFVATLQHPLCTLHPYIHSLSIRGRKSSSNDSVIAALVAALVGLPNLTSLEIVAEHSLLSEQSYALFRTHFRSLRHLFLCVIFTTCTDAMGLVTSFPLLESLRLHARWIGSLPMPPSILPPNLHTLDLGGFSEDVLVWLLSCPPSPTMSSVQLRDVAHNEFGVVFRYLSSVAGTVKSFQLGFLDKRSEKTFLESNFDTIETPELRALGVEGRLSDDVTLITHLLSHLRAPQLEEVSFSCLIAVNHRRPAWSQLDTRLSSSVYACIRKVTIITLPHAQRAIQAALPLLYERHILDLVFPKGL